MRVWSWRRAKMVQSSNAVWAASLGTTESYAAGTPSAGGCREA